MRGARKALLWLILVLAVAGGIAYGFFVDVWTVSEEDPRLAASLAPNMAIGDVVIVSHDYGARIGWLVRCTDPESSGRFVVGRVAGMNRAKLLLESGRLFVDNRRASTSSSCLERMVTVYNPATGSEVEESCTQEEIGSSRHNVLQLPNAVETRFETDVRPGLAFLVSDNRTLHYDSRDYGQVDPQTCQHVILRVYGSEGWMDSAHRLTLLY
jgi:signal peptidase I